MATVVAAVVGIKGLMVVVVIVGVLVLVVVVSLVVVDNAGGEGGSWYRQVGGGDGGWSPRVGGGAVGGRSWLLSSRGGQQCWR